MSNIRTNKRRQACIICGAMVEPGEGMLYFVSEEDNEDMDRFDAPSGWLVQHLDHDLCQRLAAERDAALAAERKSAQERKAARAAERAALVAQAQAIVGKAPDVIDWSWDDFRFRLGKAVAESEHFEAREYYDGDELVGFTVRERKCVS
jgi:hypothetical protein